MERIKRKEKNMMKMIRIMKILRNKMMKMMMTRKRKM